MFDGFLNHRCNIIHQEDTSVNVGYGIDAGNVSVPGNKPSLDNIPCHFHIRSNTLKIVQNEPYSSINGEVKLSLPADTDILENDIVTDCETGRLYRAGIPKIVHGGHHKIVMLMREEGVKASI